MVRLGAGGEPADYMLVEWAAALELRPAVRARAPGAERTVRRRHLSQEDYATRDVQHLPTTGITYSEDGRAKMSIYNVLTACAKLGSMERTKQHDRTLELERVSRRTHREPSSVVPPRTRDVADRPPLQGKGGAGATADELTLQWPMEDEPKASQIGWLARATAAARGRFSSSTVGEEEEEEEGEAETEQGTEQDVSRAESEGAVDFSAERPPSSSLARCRRTQ